MKTEEQVKNRLKDINMTIIHDKGIGSLSKPIEAVESPDLAYMRGYSDALAYVLADKEILKRL